jgi:hypothetical protein
MTSPGPRPGRGAHSAAGDAQEEAQASAAEKALAAAEEQALADAAERERLVSPLADADERAIERAAAKRLAEIIGQNRSASSCPRYWRARCGGAGPRTTCCCPGRHPGRPRS